MLTIGPFAYQDDGKVSWLQITAGDDGVCNEFKQASVVDITTNTWTKLEPEQWPRLMPAYDPSVSQKNFILSLDAANKINRQYRAKRPPKKPEDPLYIVTSQTYTGTHFSVSVPIDDNSKTEGLLQAYWVPDAALQDQLNAQYQAWQATQIVAIWHHDLSDPTLNLPNLPLDFENSQRGATKPLINATDLNEYQQWKIKSTLYESMALLKAESTSSEEYRDALHFLIDGTQPSKPFSETTQTNVETVSKLISHAGINHYMKPEFYTKISTDAKTSRNSLEETESGYTATIGSVIFYIQQLLQTEIQQFFPDYPIQLLIKIETLSSMFKLGTLPSDEIEESSSGLNRQEITQIDHIYRLATNPIILKDLSEENCAEIEHVIGSIQRRLANTEAIASTLRLLFPNCNDDVYEQTLQKALKEVQTIRQARPLTQLLNQILISNAVNNESELITSLPMITSENQDMVFYAMKNLTKDQQSIMLSLLLHHKEKFDAQSVNTSVFFNKFDSQILHEIVTQELRSGTPDTREHYALIAREFIIEPRDSQAIKETLDAAFPSNGEQTKLAALLEIAYSFEVVTMLRTRHNKMNGDLLAQQIRQCLQDPMIIDKQSVLAPLLPNLDESNNVSAVNAGANILVAGLKELTVPQRIEILVTLFTTQTVRNDAIKILGNDASPVDFNIILGLFNALPVEEILSHIGNENELSLLRHLFRSYQQTTTHHPHELLTGLSEDLLDKMTFQISHQAAQEMGGTFPKTNHLTDWQQTKDEIVALFAPGGGQDVVEKLQTAKSPHDLKVLLLIELVTGSGYQTQHLVGLSFQRLTEHHEVLLQPLPHELRTQLKSCGELGRSLALEFQHLESKGNCAAKLARLQAAMERLPKKITELELHTLLRDPQSALARALFSPTGTQRAGLTFFEKKGPEPDFAVLKAIKTCMTRLERSVPKSATNPRPGRNTLT
ncbi:MAG: hypothetical protein NTU48_09125 [Legionellales bacterium]|nr:hypothetical protein [Legionellales bacterium]